MVYIVNYKSFSRKGNSMIWLLTGISGATGIAIGLRYRFYALLAASLVMLIMSGLLSFFEHKTFAFFLLSSIGLLSVMQLAYLLGATLSERKF